MATKESSFIVTHKQKVKELFQNILMKNFLKTHSFSIFRTLQPSPDGTLHIYLPKITQHPNFHFSHILTPILFLFYSEPKSVL